MNDQRRNRIYVAASLLFAAALLLNACGNTDKKSTSPASAPGNAVAVGMSSCTSCHTVVAADWMASRHANLDPAGNLYSAGVPTLGQISGCTLCHDPLSDSSNLTPGYTGNAARPVIGCEACHGGGSLHATSGGSGAISLLSGTYVATSIGSTAVSGQFAMCTFCHELLNSTGTGTVAATHTTIAPTGTHNTITDTHFAVAPATYSSSPANPIAGYAMDYASERVCTDCHNPHGTAAINVEWAASGHGDRTKGPWKTINWSCDGTDLLACGATSTTSRPQIDTTTTANDRRFCQRCHTTSQYISYADANAAGDRTSIQAIWNGLVSSVTYTSAWKPEMLECNGCHANNRGELRDPGAYNATYGFRSGTPSYIYASASYQYPDVSSSNVCILCHSGRNIGATIHALNTAGTPSTVDLTNLSISTPHDMTAAGSMFGASGYEYAGRTYADPASYRHAQIGTSAVPDTGTGGPCVGCHMYRTGLSANHLFTAVSKSGDTVTNVSSEVCFLCHAGSSTGLAVIVDSERLLFDEALQALDAQLRAVGLITGSAYPGGSTATSWLSPGDMDTTGNNTGKNNMGAAFNRSFLMNEAGAYVHNSKYAKRLIYDSIDWADDNNLNYSVGSTLSTSPIHSGMAWQDGAMSYLLPNGVKLGASAERPY